MKHKIVKRWYAANSPHPLLLPLSYVYRAAVATRHWCYQQGWFATTHFNIPVIVVGNLTVGGTGKTPLVAWLCDWLRTQGLRPGLVSRGYGGRANQWPQAVTVDSDPAWVGDEAVMLVQQTGCPMLVGPNRVAATRALLTQYPCDVVISDDGLQHLALGRAIEIVVIDGKRGFGNGFCLPAGPLREPIARLHQVDFQISTGLRRPGAWCMHLYSGNIFQIMAQQKRLLPSDLLDKKVHAVAGIGHPQRFFDQLTELGISFTPHAFADHYHYRPEDIDFANDSIVIMTEKDAVKCRAFADQRHWCLPVTAQLDPGFAVQLAKKLKLELRE